MKISMLLRTALAVFFFASQAMAQNAGTATNHAFIIGKGAGTTGYTSLLCGSAQLAVGQTTADPICRTITGDVTITAAGATAIGSAKVTAAMFAGLTSAELATILSNETGTPGFVVFSISPALTGTPTAPTASPSDNSTKIATTAYVDAQVVAGTSGVASIDTATGAITISGLLARSSQDLRVVAATTANQETATSTTTAVTPSVQQRHPSAAKAWAYCTNSGGTYTLAASYNISGGTCGKTGTGQLTLTFATAFSATTAFGCQATQDGANSFISASNVSTTQVSVTMRDVTNAAVDRSFFLTCFGDQ